MSGFLSLGNYTIPRTIGELQLRQQSGITILNYTIPRTTGELQRKTPAFIYNRNYTIPRTTGELQLHTLWYSRWKHYTICIWKYYIILKKSQHIKRSSHKKYIFLTFPKNSSKLKPCSYKTAGNITLPATLPTDKKISSISCRSKL